MTNSPIELVRPVFTNNTLKLPVIYRFNQSGLRYYFTIQDLIAIFYPSVTTVIEKTTPTSYGIKKLIGELGLSGFYRMMSEKAHYGTIHHYNAADYSRYFAFDFNSMYDRVLDYFKRYRIDYDEKMLDEWVWNLKKDLASVIRFIIDHNVEPLMIEAVGTYTDPLNPNLRVGGALDLICRMDWDFKGYFGEVYKTGPRKGQPKETKSTQRVTAVVDFKSGKTGFFEDYEIQLHMYKMIAEQTFGIQIDKLFNVAPVDWDTEPTFKIKDQTDSTAAAKIPHLLEVFHNDWSQPKDILLIDGELNGTNLSDVCRWVSASEYVIAKSKTAEYKEQDQIISNININHPDKPKPTGITMLPQQEVPKIQKNKKAINEIANMLNLF